MTHLITNIGQARANILRFPAVVQGDASMRARLGFHRAWYAERDANGAWVFGPSKFIGYKGLDGDSYNPKQLDGRETERQLDQWYEEVPVRSPLFDELDRELRAFLASHRKAPSKLFRISVPSGEAAKAGEGAADHTQPSKIAELIIAVGRNLPIAEQKRIKAAF